MKKVVAVLLSIVFAVSSVGAVPVLAVETNEQEAVEQDAEPEDNEKADDEAAPEISFTGETAHEAEEESAPENEPEKTSDEGENTEEQNESQNADTINTDTINADTINADTTKEASPSDQESEDVSVGEKDGEDLSDGVNGEETSNTEDLFDESAGIGRTAIVEEETAAVVENIAAGEADTSGTCGDSLTWELDSEGTLTISGTGDMDDYSYDPRAPWYDLKDNITAIVCNEGVTGIGEYAFNSCDKVSEITLPQSLQTIGYCAFYRAHGPSVLNLPENLSSIGSCAFEYMSGIEEICIPDSVVNIGAYAFSYCSELRSATIGKGITNIPSSAFLHDYTLEQVILSEGLQTIGPSAFKECHALKQIIIPSTVTALGENAFSHCSSLTEAVLPENLQVIPYRGFYYCVSLAKIEIPDSVTQINAQAFAYCRSISEVTLPADLDNLEDEVFLGCINLKRVVLPENEFDVGENVYSDCAEGLQFLDRNEQVLPGATLGEVTPAVSSNGNGQNYTVWNAPRNSYLVDEGTSRLRVEYTGESLTREYYSDDGVLLSRSSISMELPLFGGFFAGENSYYLVFGQSNTGEDDSKEVIRIVRYSKEWVRQGAASICGENTTLPFEAGTVSLTETDGVLYLRTSHLMYASMDGLRHQANLTAVIRTSDMTVTSCISGVSNSYYGYVSHSFSQIIKSDGEDVIAADHGDAYPRGIILFRYAGKAGSETLGYPKSVMVFPIAGATGANSTGASLGALEASSSHYLVAGNSVAQEEEDYSPGGTRNIFVTATPKGDFTKEATVTHWLTSYNSGEKISTPVMTVLPNDRFLLMWTVDGVLNYCFIAADGSMEGEVYAGEGSLSDCQPYEKDNAVWWYVTKNSAPLYFYISLDDPGEVHIQNPGHTVGLDAMGGMVEADELEVVHGGTYGELPTPQREAGYEFLGWYTQKYYGTQITPDTSVRIRNSETLYAHWKHHWSFEKETGLLTVYAAGDMGDYSSDWADIRDFVKQVKIEKGVTAIYYSAFKDFTALEKVEVADTVTVIWVETFAGCTSLTSIQIPEGVTTIGNNAFKGCSSLREVVLPSSLTSIGSYAFEDCSSLVDVIIPSNVTRIGFGAFNDCSGVTNVSIPASVTEIDLFTFRGCSSLTDVVIPSSVTSIDYGAFANCSSLASITIPSSVSSIDSVAFYNCPDDLIIYGDAGSFAEEYADTNGLKFVDPTRLEYADVTGVSSKTYTGSPVTQSPIVKLGTMTLVSGTDYEVSYTDNTNVGTGTMMITGKGEYTGSITSTFVITPASIADSTVAGITDRTYTGTEQTQTLTVMIGNTALSAGTDYELAYTDNTDAGTATITITGVGNYSGMVTRTFAINAVSIENAVVTGITDRTYTGTKQTQTPTVMIGNTALSAGTDYELSYIDNTNAGTATITITGIGNYTGTITKTFTILPGKTSRGDMFNLANNVKVTWKEVPGAKYYKVYREGITDSSETRQDPVIVTDRLVGWDKDPGLTNGHAYRYKIVASLTGKDAAGKSDPSGDSTLSYSKLMYRLKTVAIRSVKNTAPGKVTVKYDKSTSGDSYVLQYCERQDMVGAKTKVVLGANNTSYTIGGLKKGKTYYISIRVRKKVNGIDYYTTFGVAKKIKIVK